MRPFAILPQSAVKRSGDRVGSKGILGQVFVNDPSITSAAVPEGANFVFAEAIGSGGGGYAEFGNYGLAGGGAGADGIVPVRASDALTFSIASSTKSNVQPPPTTVSISGTVVVSANSSRFIVQGASEGATGKYPGGSPSYNPVRGGKGGGRLAGKVQAGTGSDGGIGCGAAATGNQTTQAGGVGAVCLTFFEGPNEALDFARAVYGGAWVP